MAADPSYTVTFNDEDGASLGISQDIERGKTATRPPDPTKDGSVFDDWYTDQSYSQPYTFAAPVTKNITLYAKWGLHSEESAPDAPSPIDEQGQKDDLQESMPGKPSDTNQLDSAEEGSSDVNKLNPRDVLTFISDGSGGYSITKKLGANMTGELTIPEKWEDGKSITRIGPGAFKGYSGLTRITFPASLESIGHGAFKDCTELTSITFPASLTLLGDYAFTNCSKLTSVTVNRPAPPDLGVQVFDYCPKLQQIKVPREFVIVYKSGWDAYRNKIKPLLSKQKD